MSLSPQPRCYFSSRSSPLPVSFFTLLPLVRPGPFFRILVAYFCISSSSHFPDQPPFPFVLLSRVVLGPSLMGIVSACSWALSRYQKTVDSQQHRRGDGKKPTGLMFCLLWGFFSNPSSSFHSLYICHFISSGFK